MTAPLVLHDWSPFSDTCLNCGLPMRGAPPVCVPTTAEPGEDE